MREETRNLARGLARSSCRAVSLACCLLLLACPIYRERGVVILFASFQTQNSDRP